LLRNEFTLLSSSHGTIWRLQVDSRSLFGMQELLVTPVTENGNTGLAVPFYDHLVLTERLVHDPAEVLLHFARFEHHRHSFTSFLV
jgi:hypothetical protein